MTVWILAALVLLATGVVAGGARERAHTNALKEALAQPRSRDQHGMVDFGSVSGLPPPVARYFRLVLADGQRTIWWTKLCQSGVLRVGTNTDRWLAFTARHLVAPAPIGFVWNARVQMPLRAHLRVTDSYINGAGAGRVSLFSVVPIATEADTPELNAGALHRYLAEAVWFPTALLPEAGVAWTSIDENTALATLGDGTSTVSLEFRFSEAGEVTSIYSPGRWSRSGAGYRLVPWEGHFRDYREHAGMRIPFYGEVGWYSDGKLELVWKGSLVDARYEFAPATPRKPELR